MQEEDGAKSGRAELLAASLVLPFLQSLSP